MPMINTFSVAGYRSIRQLTMLLDRLNIITGANGIGKSSFYKSLRLLADIAQGRIISSLAIEGGLQSTLWAGPENFSRGMKARTTPIQGTSRRNPISLKLGFASDDYGYAIDLGLPVPNAASQFNRDPIIKSEAVWTGQTLRRNNIFASRKGPVVQVLNDTGNRKIILSDISAYDSMMTHAADPQGTPELLLLRERMRQWRFYDHFRTDPDAPARRAQIGTRTQILASDGGDLAAAIQTINEIGDIDALNAAIEDAFPGSTVEITQSDGLFEIAMRQTGLLRALRVSELSDGTLRYLLLVAALLTPRPPSLLVLNEPETSLHPQLLAPLARLIYAASKRSQIIIVSHAQQLVAALSQCKDSAIFNLKKQLGETIAPDADVPRWQWPDR